MKNKKVSDYYLQFVDIRKTTKTFLTIALLTSIFLGTVSRFTKFYTGSNMFFALAGVTAILIIFHLKGFYNFSGFVLSIILPLVTTYMIIDGNGLNDPGVLGYSISMVVNTLIFGRRSIAAYTLLNTLLVSFAYWVEQRGFFGSWINTNQLIASRFDLVIVLTLLLISSYFMWLIMGIIERNIQTVLESETQVKDAYDLTLEGWASALELRDKETEGHSRRVTELTVNFAEKLGYSGTFLINIRRGALLHDIGKMGIPDEILKKVETLTENDWEIIRMHPIHAYEMLKDIDYLKPAIDIPCFHHEQWDGLGYPQGLAEDEIPIAARIFSLVDNWDALTSDRPYRPAWSEDTTREYFINEAGKKFDPELLPVFFELLSTS